MLPATSKPFSRAPDALEAVKSPASCRHTYPSEIKPETNFPNRAGFLFESAMLISWENSNPAQALSLPAGFTASQKLDRNFFLFTTQSKPFY
jgi:hypothetical protein